MVIEEEEGKRRTGDGVSDNGSDCLLISDNLNKP